MQTKFKLIPYTVFDSDRCNFLKDAPNMTLTRLLKQTVIRFYAIAYECMVSLKKVVLSVCVRGFTRICKVLKRRSQRKSTERHQFVVIEYNDGSRKPWTEVKFFYC